MKKIYETIEEETSDCGICCLSTIIKYYGGYIPLETLRINTNTDISGCNAYELINCSKKIGFNSYGKKIEKINKDTLIKYPIIAHLKLPNNFYHFVVIYKIKNNNVYIMDPAIGIKKVNIDEFNKEFTGVLLYFEPINSIVRYKKNNFFVKNLKKELLSNKNNYLKILIFNLCIMLFTLIISMEINILNKNKNFFYLLIIIIIVNEILILTKNKLLINLTNKFNKRSINNFIELIFKLPLKYLNLKRSGELQTRFIELNELTTNLINIISTIIFEILITFILLIIIFFMNINISIYLIFMCSIYIFINIKIYNKLTNYIRYSINLEENYNSNIIEYIKNIETIKNLNKYNYFLENINNNLTNKNIINQKLNNKISIINFINNLIINIFLLIILLMVIKYKLTIINSMTIYILISYYISSIKKIISYYPIYLTFKTTINKNNDFLSCEIKKEKYKLEKFNEIRMQNIVYKINNFNIINNITFNIKDKDKIFIFGKSGIGKSTLMRILNKEINNYKGIITLDNKDLNDCDIKNLISYTSQNEYLFDDSIINNITLKEEIDNKVLSEIIKICRVNSVIDNKTFGFESLILNNSNISGGEKNRIILARSLVHSYSKKIIILDEVLREVDEKLEKNIIKDILKFYESKTIIYISHRNIGNLFNKRFDLERSK